MASDDEIERRLRQLKGIEEPAGARSGAGSTGAGAGFAAPGGSPALEGVVIEPAGRGGSGGSGGRGGSGRPGGRGGPGAPGTAGGGPTGVGTRVVTWSVGQAFAGRLGMWVGVALVVIGTYYVLAAFVPGVRVVGSLGVAVLGVALLAANATRRAGDWSRTVGAILLGAGLLPFVAGIAGLGANGWGSLGAGLGLLALAALRASRGRSMGWQGVVGAFLAIWGAWGVLGDRVPGFPTLGDLIVPGILVLLGLVFVRRGARGPSR